MKKKALMAVLLAFIAVGSIIALATFALIPLYQKPEKVYIKPEQFGSEGEMIMGITGPDFFYRETNNYQVSFDEALDRDADRWICEYEVYDPETGVRRSGWCEFDNPNTHGSDFDLDELIKEFRADPDENSSAPQEL